MSKRNPNKRQRRLTTTSYVLLAQLSLRPWSPYDLASQRVRYFRFVWPRAESAIYREVKQLARDGLAETRVERTGKRKRTVYSITDEGIDALRQWLGTPVSPFALEFEAIIRLFVAPIGTTEQLVDTLHRVRLDADDMLDFAGEVRREFLEGRNALQDQVHLRALGVDFFISFIHTVRDWVERTLVEIERWEGLSVEERNERGLEIIDGLAVPVPEGAATGTAVMPESLERRPITRRS
jgi:PadR family transcriptional regulator AphA